MKISRYNVFLDRENDDHPVLVKDYAVEYESAETLNSAEKVAGMLNGCFKLSEMAEERLYLVVMNSQARPLGVFEVSHGTARCSYASTRELMIRVLLCGGTFFVVAHNHPSGCTTPSDDDKKTAKTIKKAADLMQVPMLDFIIVGGNKTCSFSREGLLE